MLLTWHDTTGHVFLLVSFGALLTVNHGRHLASLSSRLKGRSTALSNSSTAVMLCPSKLDILLLQNSNFAAWAEIDCTVLCGSRLKPSEQMQVGFSGRRCSVSIATPWLISNKIHRHNTSAGTRHRSLKDAFINFGEVCVLPIRRYPCVCGNQIPAQRAFLDLVLR